VRHGGLDDPPRHEPDGPSFLGILPFNLFRPQNQVKVALPKERPVYVFLAGLLQLMPSLWFGSALFCLDLGTLHLWKRVLVRLGKKAKKSNKTSPIPNKFCRG